MEVTDVIFRQSFESAMVTKNSNRTKSVENRNSFSEVLNGQQKKCPYSSLANDGVIDYNGVVFVCDYESNSLCLGDMSNPKDVLKISLPSGGCLKINVNNLGDLANAAGMFSPSDLSAILRAVSQYNHFTGKLHEAEEDEVETVENATDQTDVQGDLKRETVGDEEKHMDISFSTVTLFQPAKGAMSFSDAIRQFEEAHKIEAQDLKEDKDWRDMSAEEWDKMMEGVDNYIDAFREQLKKMRELQEDAVQKAVLTAEPGRRSIAASSAALAVKNGFVTGNDTKKEASEIDPEEEGAEHEKNWTRTLNTDDQAILMKEQKAQKMEGEALSRFQELLLVGNTVTGISSEEGMIECISSVEDEKKEKVWTITNIDKDGLTCKKYQDGIVLSSWKLEYPEAKDMKYVEDFISGFKKDENLRFAGIQEFWNEFLSGNITKDDLVLKGDTWEWSL